MILLDLIALNPSRPSNPPAMVVGMTVAKTVAAVPPVSCGTMKPS